MLGGGVAFDEDRRREFVRDVRIPIGLKHLRLMLREEEKCGRTVEYGYHACQVPW
jgi:hypothetical protein